MKQNFILWDTTPFNGFIRFAGFADMDAPPDGSTTKERIAQLLIKYPTITLYVYAGGGDIPDREVVKFDPVGEKFDPLTVSDITPEVAEADRKTAAIAELKLNDLAGKTYAEVETWIDAQVTDLASARGVLKKMAKVILAMLKHGGYSD